MKRSLFIITVFLTVCVTGVHAQNKSLSAVAIIKGTAPDSAITGTVNLTESADGLIVEASLENVPGPGDHGFHIHEVGDCGDMGKAAGGHFNPAKVTHGHMLKDGPERAHAGDMGNITVTSTGRAKLTVTLPDVGLKDWQYNVAGLSIILHEKADDFGQPVGNAGGRIACGIIEIKK